MCQDGLQAEAARHGTLIARMDRMAVEVGALRRDLSDAEERLHDARRYCDDVCTMVADGEQSDVVAVEEDMRREASPILSRVQGLEVHAQVNMVKLDQRLASLEASSGKVAVGGLGGVQAERRSFGR